MHALFTWIGNSDLTAAEKNQPANDPGPILRLLRSVRSFDGIHLLHDYSKEKCDAFLEWLRPKVAPIPVREYGFVRPLKNDYRAAYEFNLAKVQEILATLPLNPNVGFLLSPGMPAAQIAMILVAQQLFRPEQLKLYNTWPSQSPPDFQEIDLPYAISVDHLIRKERLRSASGEVRVGAAFDEILGTSEALLRAKQMATHVAPFDVTVLLEGESGTGKERFARAIHASSKRHKQGEFVALNCAAVPESLLEAELFGYVAGAFTDARRDRPGHLKRADKGTLFLDEIGDMPPSLQAKLLRVLQEGTYYPVGADQEVTADVRIIAATHRNLDQSVRNGTFRGDLLYRLDQVRVPLPSLRSRGGDIAILADKFLERFCADHFGAAGAKYFDDDARLALKRLPWPGNVRELENAVTRIAIFAVGPTITAADVADWVPPPLSAEDRPLRQLGEDELLNQAAAVMDELIERYARDRTESTDKFFEVVTEPLAVGRAFYALGREKQSRVRELLGYQFDRSRGEADKKRLRVYDEMYRKRIDEDRVTELRGGEQ